MKPIDLARQFHIAVLSGLIKGGDYITVDDVGVRCLATVNDVKLQFVFELPSELQGFIRVVAERTPQTWFTSLTHCVASLEDVDLRVLRKRRFTLGKPKPIVHSEVVEYLTQDGYASIDFRQYTILLNDTALIEEFADAVSMAKYIIHVAAQAEAGYITHAVDYLAYNTAASSKGNSSVFVDAYRILKPRLTLLASKQETQEQQQQQVTQA
jgi:hypothetical protein